jgi:GH15 family glucan-1,4-alpha-glucosidase
MTTASIGEHGIIGNMRSAALVNVFGAIDFFCFPEFDSPSVFASLLDSERAGSFSIRPAGEARKGRQIYLPETNVLATRFTSEDSILELCDWMPVGGEGLPHCIMRLLTATHGDLEVELRCRPAFNYARIEHTVELSGESAAFHAASTGLPSIRLRSSVGLRAEGGAALASFRLKEGESAYFILGDAQDKPVNELIPFVRGELQRTCAYWKQWAGKSVYEGRWRESVTRSALTLKLLTSAEHGSLVAAPNMCEVPPSCLGRNMRPNRCASSCRDPKAPETCMSTSASGKSMAKFPTLESTRVFLPTSSIAAIPTMVLPALYGSTTTPLPPRADPAT